MLELLQSCEGFEWDAGNNEKSWKKHGVTQAEAEQVFFNVPLFVIDDEKHSTIEPRFLLWGLSNANRFLVIVFTIRNKNLIRVISARDMNKKERNEYEKKIKKNS